MPKIPGTYKRRVMPVNGDGTPPNIPDDLVYDPNDPITICTCSSYTEHNADCDGNCGELEATQNMINLINECRAWQRSQMTYTGLPASLAGGPFPGINVDVLDTDLRSEVLQEILIEHLGVTSEEIDERFREKKFEKLHAIREAVEPRVREARVRSMIDIPGKPKGIIGPHGEILG